MNEENTPVHTQTHTHIPVYRLPGIGIGESSLIPAIPSIESYLITVGLCQGDVFIVEYWLPIWNPWIMGGP